jgi:hypothetical protein
MNPDRRIDAFSDEDLIAWLRRAVADVDPVPDQVLIAARAAISTRDLDGELAVLVADSHAQDDQSLGALFEPVRSHTPPQNRPRLLTFAGGGVQIDLELGPRQGLVDVVGQFTGSAPGECAIQHASMEWRRLDVDELGRFLFSGLPPGPVRLRCQSTRATPVITAWTTV